MTDYRPSLKDLGDLTVPFSYQKVRAHPKIYNVSVEGEAVGSVQFSHAHMGQWMAFKNNDERLNGYFGTRKLAAHALLVA